MKKWTLNLRWLSPLAATALLLAAPWTAAAAPAPTAAPTPAVPPELQPWIEWVKGVELPPGECRDVDGTVICVWPTRLAVSVGKTGGSFELEVTAHDAESVLLPGDDSVWPQDIQIDGKPAVVVDEAGTPSVRLAVGRHRISGVFLWSELPDSVAVPPEVALVELRRDGKRVAFPERQDGLLRLGDDGELDDEAEPDAEATPDSEVEDALRVEVSRWLRDGVPLTVVTRVDLRVSGRTRELTLPYPLWDDAELLRVDSDLPIAFGEGRALVLQARPGSHTVTLEAALPRQLETLAPPKLAAPWPADEVWVWKAAPTGEAALGQVALSGGQAVDRSRTHAPTDWEGGATFRVTATTPLAFEVLQRGASETARNELALDRVMWFDLDGAGWSVVDVLRGRMHHGARLDLQPGALGSVIVNGRPQVVTSGVGGASGVEVRSVELELHATWRGAQPASALPVGGWSEPFDRVTLAVELPRGWDVLRASGPGSNRSTWIESWRPLDLLLLLGVCVLIGRMLSPWVGAAALLGLGLAYTRSGDGYVELVLLIAFLTVITGQLRRDHGSWATWALRGLWIAGAGLLTAWMVWQVPVGVRAVWQGGESALAHRHLERELGQLAELEAVGAALVLVVYGLAWLITRARGAGQKAAVGFTVLVGGAIVLGLALATSGGPMAVAQSDEPYEVEEEPPPDMENSDEEAGGSGQRHRGEEGKMGKPTSRAKSGLYAMKGPKDAVSSDNEVWGGLNGTEIGEAFGVGGLGLVGTGRGGGGTGEGTIGLGNTGLIGKGGDGDEGGTGSGYGRGAGAGFGGRGTSVPTVRQAKATVSGALDRDIIRRIVRAHINEVRYCYNQGLARDPALAGRIVVNFTISGDGKVSAAAVGETTLKDAAVGTCISQAVRRWTFPKPKTGTVEVEYPFVLETDGAPASGAAASDERYVLDADLPKAPPSALPQTGEGTPEWSDDRWTLNIDHAVKPDETVSLWLLSPTASKGLALLRALTLWILGFSLVRAGWRAGWGRLPRERVSATSSTSAARTAGVIAVFLGSLLGMSQIAGAAPAPELLEELERRVTAERAQAPEPECAPSCALVARLGVDVAARTLRLNVEVHMAGPGVYRLPGSFDSWMPQTVNVDRRPAEELIAIEGQVFVRLAEGVHSIELAGPLGVDELNLGLTDAPKRVDVKAKGWDVEGIDEDGHASNLHFVAASATKPRADDDDDKAEAAAPTTPGEPDPGDRVSQDLPTWLSVDRQLEIGPRWTMRTVVTRQNHGPSPITVQVPLLAGEKMLEATAKVSDPKATVSLEQAGATISWVSVLEPRDTLVLAAPQGSPWTETWTVTCGEAWQCAMTGLPATRVDAGKSVFHPWPGETLTIALHQPPPVDGPLLTVDRATLRYEVADAGTEAQLSLIVRAATVTTRTVTLPAGAHLGSVKIAGAEVPMARDATELRLPLQPGVSEVEIEWKQDDGVKAVYVAPTVSLGGLAVNARLVVDFVDESDRVILWTGGSADGPFVWLWPWFGALALLAVVLGRAPGAPLRPWKWLVLGLGFGAGVLPVLAAWFLLVAWRPALVRRVNSDHGYNALQFGYALLTAAVLLLALATGKALLTSPVWTLVDNWSGDGGLLRWYADRVEDTTPGAWIVSVPASLWRALWALWALWIAWQSIGWGRWAWHAIAAGGWLRMPPPPADEPDETDAPKKPGASSPVSS